MQLEAVANSNMWKCRTRRLPDVDGCAGASCQLLVARNEVGVQMGLEDMANLQLLFLSRFEIDFKSRDRRPLLRLPIQSSTKRAQDNPGRTVQST